MATKNRQCNIVLDSCCDLPRDLVASLEVELLQFPFIMDDGEHLDDLGVSLPPHSFYERLRKGEVARTAQIPYPLILNAFEKAALSGVPTVFLCFSSGLSGTFDSVLRALGETLARHPNAELYVVDTLLASAAEGLLALEACRQRDRGLTAQELVAWAEEARYFVNGYFTLANLDALRRGGRIPNMAAVAGAKLDIRPILTFDLDGRLTFHGAARGRKKSIRQLLQIYTDRVSKAHSSTVFVVSADAPKEVKDLEEQVLKLGPCHAVFQASIGPVIGAHVGPDMLAIVFWGPDRRKEISITDRIAVAVSERHEALRSRLGHGDIEQ